MKKSIRVQIHPLRHFPAVGVAFAIIALLPMSSRAATGPDAPPMKIGDRVQTSIAAKIFDAPPIGGKPIGVQPPASSGTVTSGPVRAGEVWWWKVDFQTGADGWAPERQLASPNGQPPGGRIPAGFTPPKPPGSEVFLKVLPTDNAVVTSPNVMLQGKLMPDVYSPALVALTVNGKKVTVNPDGGFVFPASLSPGANVFNFEATTPNPRQQVNSISAYLDGSVIYGSDATRAAALRAFQGGKLKTSGDNLMPLNTAGLANANDAHIFPDNALFLAGDVRANENVELSAIQTLFVREHNLLAAAIASANPSLNDEQVFQAARRIVVGEVQVITYREFLPALLGPNALRPYRGYDPDVNPGIATEFSTAAYRIGHTLINDDVELLDNDANPVDDPLELSEAFFNPSVLQAVGPAPLLKYLASDKAQEVDTQLVEGLRNFLFGPPGAGGFDLASLNIQRGRDHGLPDYNSVRAAYGLPRVTSVSQITADTAVQAKLLALYGNVDSLDVWIAGLAEDHVAGSSVGPTFQRIIANQFERIRDGDRFWYALTFSGPQLDALERTRLSDVIRRNTTITKLQDNVFFFNSATLAGLTPRTGILPKEFTKLPPVLGPAPSLDGKSNNPLHVLWGSAGVDLMRFTPAAYGDSLSTPAGSGRPSARAISNSLCDHTATASNARNLSDWVYGWGQFIDHDLDLTSSGDTAFDVLVPKGDPDFDPSATGTAKIYLNRSIYDSATGTSTPSVRKLSITVQFKPAPKK